MNEKINDKPIEMPARGRPRKKESGSDHNVYGNEYEVQKSLYSRNNFSQFMSNGTEPNSILDFIEGSSDKEVNGISNMYPYKKDQRGLERYQMMGGSQMIGGPQMTGGPQTYGARQDMRQNIRQEDMRQQEKINQEGSRSEVPEKEASSANVNMLEEFNKIGEMFLPYNTSSSYASEELVQVSPKEVQNSRSEGKYKSSSVEEKRNSSSEIGRQVSSKSQINSPSGSYGGSHTPNGSYGGSSYFKNFEPSSDSFSMKGSATYGSSLDLGSMRIEERPLDYSQYGSRDSDLSYMGTNSSSGNSYSSSYDQNKGGGDLPRNGLYNRQSRPFKEEESTSRHGNYFHKTPNTPAFDNNMKRVCIHSPSPYPQEGYPGQRNYNQIPPPFFAHTPHPNHNAINHNSINLNNQQQWYPSFTNDNQIPLSHFRNILQTRENVPEQHPPQMFADSMFGPNPWYNRKKRKNNPLLWQYSKNAHEATQSIMHPSKYSSLDYIQGVDTPNKMYPLPSKRLQTDRETNNSILPLFLSSNKELTDEYREVVVNFRQKITELDFTNVTVQQLKIFMREFGLNHTGKKNELIDRLKSTLNKLDNRCTRKTEEVKKNPEVKEDDYGFYFF